MNLHTRRAGTRRCSFHDPLDILRLADIVLGSSMRADLGVRPGHGAREQSSTASGGWKSGSWYWAVLVLLIAAMVAATAIGISLRIL